MSGWTDTHLERRRGNSPRLEPATGHHFFRPARSPATGPLSTTSNQLVSRPPFWTLFFKGQPLENPRFLPPPRSYLGVSSGTWTPESLSAAPEIGSLAIKRPQVHIPLRAMEPAPEGVTELAPLLGARVHES